MYNINTILEAVNNENKGVGYDALGIIKPVLRDLVFDFYRYSKKNGHSYPSGYNNIEEWQDDLREMLYALSVFDESIELAFDNAGIIDITFLFDETTNTHKTDYVVYKNIDKERSIIEHKEDYDNINQRVEHGLNLVKKHLFDLWD